MIFTTKSIINLYGAKGSIESNLGKKVADLINDALCNSDEGRSCALGNAVPYTSGDMEMVRKGEMKLNSEIELTEEHKDALGRVANLMDQLRINYVH